MCKDNITCLGVQKKKVILIVGVLTRYSLQSFEPTFGFVSLKRAHKIAFVNRKTILVVLKSIFISIVNAKATTKCKTLNIKFKR